MASKQAEGTTTIGRGASLRGDLVTTGDIVIEGDLEGSLKAEESRVTVGREAHVRADVHAREVVLEGKLVGTVFATERVELRSTAHVDGTIHARRFAMEENAVLHGRVDPTVQSAPGGESPAPAVATPPAQMPRAAQPAEPATLFSSPSGARTPGHMPAGLAAAARTLNTGAPVGANALAEEDTRGNGA